MRQLKQVLEENYYIEIGIEEHEASFGEFDLREDQSITHMRAEDYTPLKAALVAPREMKVNMQRSLFDSMKLDVSGEEAPAKPQQSPPRKPLNEQLATSVMPGIPFGDTGGSDEEANPEEEEEEEGEEEEDEEEEDDEGG